MNKVIYIINRHKDDIIFKQEGNVVYMYGGKYIRTSTSGLDVIDMVDPAGGPCIFLGSDLGRYFNDGVSRTIKEINIIEGKDSHNKNIDIVKFII